jgi:uncharacterized protein YndB with AHSA1/START domain
MKYKLELTIEKPLAEVWNAFDSSDNLKKWQPTLKSVEHVSGTPGQSGAESTLTYEEGEREFTLTERIILREEPGRFDAVYENKFTDNTNKNIFTEQGPNKTLWVLEAEYKFKTTAMKFLGVLKKKNFVARSQKDMEQFKEFAESL